jgi:hypothetical protein
MSNLKPIYVTLKEGRHKTQPWTFTIDRPGPQNKETKRERYVTMTTAKRGACRVLGAIYLNSWQEIMKHGSIYESTPKRIVGFRPVKFIVQRMKKSK